ncbi:hypothetical protein Syun_022816 [Stephania yunnanensis]|uniref:Protein RIK n=1 Tax=Stephania yunnanensis TaxID=152371 RepID=A0AAP0FA66_9MAGN
MAEDDSCPKSSQDQFMVATEGGGGGGGGGGGASALRQRKKRRWDQPAESSISPGLGVPGVLPFSNIGSAVGIAFPGVAALSGVSMANLVPTTCAAISQVLQGSLLAQQNVAAVVQKLNQPKIQDEIIAREIVINDAESTIRYKLTKRQTQEEIQRCTGAVVITRGKYHPPNTPPDGERPLYLHISSGAHLKETAERIKAVDRAAVMVEEMLKQGPFSQPNSTSFPAVAGGVPQLTACVFLGFDPDPSKDIVASVRGPNDQYINHIMNETGATVLLRGKGAENFEGPQGEDFQQQLHLHLSCTNLKSLETAKVLAENLLDTVAAEFGASRMAPNPIIHSQKMGDGDPKAHFPYPENMKASPKPIHYPYLESGGGLRYLDISCLSISNFRFVTIVLKVSEFKILIWNMTSKVYNAVPPPQKLLVGAESSMNEMQGGVSSLTSLTMCSAPVPPASTSPHPGFSNQSFMGISQSMGSLNYVKPLSNANYYSQPSLSSGTCYSGYGGIYPQATPLQQVALVLRQAPASVISAPLSATEKTQEENSKPILEKEKFPPQKRKFQELPVISRQPAIQFLDLSTLQNSLQDIEDNSLKNISTMSAPKKLAQPFSNGMPPPPPRMKPPPPPPKFASSSVPSKGNNKDLETKTSSDSPPPPPRTSTLPPPKFTSSSAPSKTNSRDLVTKPHSDIRPLTSRMNPPPPPKFTSSLVPSKADVRNLETKSSSDLFPHKSTSESLPDTLIKLMEYGADDDDDAEEADELPKSNSQLHTTPKPFWAL